jgi:hypothetical protein
MKNLTFRKCLKHARRVLYRWGFDVHRLSGYNSLTLDLKIQLNDYYFLKMNIEDITTMEIDIGEILRCTNVKDLAILLMSKEMIT